MLEICSSLLHAYQTVFEVLTQKFLLPRVDWKLAQVSLSRYENVGLRNKRQRSETCLPALCISHWSQNSCSTPFFFLIVSKLKDDTLSIR